MKKIKLTNEEAEAIRCALKFYRDETTHDPEGAGVVGLPEGKEHKLITSAIIKLEDAKGGLEE